MNIFSNTINMLEKALDYSSVKQQVISQNIANVDTPNYKSKEVLPFKTILNKEIGEQVTAKVTNNKHIPFPVSNSEYVKIVKSDTRYNESNNGVDMDLEMSKMAENQIYYNALVERLNGKFQTLQNVIKGGK